MWTDERTENLKKLWADGLSASQIAMKLGEVTRNAVLGKVWRLGLEGRASVSRMRRSRPRSCVRVRTLAPTGRRTQTPALRTSSARPAVPLQSAVRKRELPPLGAAPETIVSVANLQDTSCRWPEGDPKLPGFHFCGRRAAGGMPYCAHHAAIVTCPRIFGPRIFRETAPRTIRGQDEEEPV
jgi:GcrA cell cycle regulator